MNSIKSTSSVRLRDIGDGDKRLSNDLSEFFVEANWDIKSILNHQSEIFPHDRITSFGDMAGMVVDADGIILDANHACCVVLGVRSGQSLAECGWEIRGAPPNLTGEGDEKSRQLYMCTVMSTDGEASYDALSLAPTTATSKLDNRVVFFQGSVDSSGIEEFGARFDLSAAELEVLRLFVSGLSIQAVAKARGRSFATVKTQFYRILEKCGCDSQSQLLQRVSVVGKLASGLNHIVKETRHPYRKSFKVPRSNSRTLEVIMTGNQDGEIIVLCSSFFLSTFPPNIEELLYKANLCVCSLEPPGCGDTSLPADGVTYERCYADDIRAFLSSIDRKEAVLWGGVTNFPFCLRVAQLIPEHITSIFSHCLAGPPKRVEKLTGVNAWIPRMRKNITDRFGSTTETSAELFFRYIRRIGASLYLQRILAHDPIGLGKFLEPDNLTCFEESFDRSMRQGFEMNSYLLRDTFTNDWEPDIKTCPVPIYIRIGTLDTSGPCCIVEDMAVQYGAKIKLHLVEGASSVYYLVSPMTLIDGLQEAISKN